MKSRTTSQDKGFLISEVMIAFSLMIVFLTSAITLSFTADGLKRMAENKLDQLGFIYENISSTTLFSSELYGNHTVLERFEPIVKSSSDFSSAWGSDTCDPRMVIETQNFSITPHDLDIGAGNTGTDIEVRHAFAYLSADSSLSSQNDLFIIDLRNPESPIVLSSLNTGPGLSAVEVAGPYLYTANLGTTHQLQVIDISNRAAPFVVARLKLPLPRASSTPPYATSIAYYKGRIYLGTEKWEGSEFNVIDVNIPNSPVFMGGFETNTQVNDIFVKNETAYIAASDIGQMRVLNVSDPENISEIFRFSPTGWETQQGKNVSYFENNLSLGRTTGGFNVTNNHELFSFPSSTSSFISKDIPGGVYGIIDQTSHTLIATRYPGQELQMWKRDFAEKVYSFSLGFSPQALACDEQTLYFVTGDSRGIGIVTTQEI